MSEERAISRAPARAAGAEFEGMETPPELRPDRTRGRLVAYLLLAIVLGAVAFRVAGDGTQMAPELRSVLEITAVVLAIMIAALALVRFYSGRNRTILYIGTGFLCTAFLDAHHAFVTSPAGPFSISIQTEAADLSVWTWLASRLFLSLFLFVSWLAWYVEEREKGAAAEEMEDELSVYITAFGLTGLIFAFFLLTPLPGAFRPDSAFTRPMELGPAVFFLLATLGYLRKGTWRRDSFEHWLILALIAGLMAQGGILPYSNTPDDLPDLTGRILKVTGYLFVLVGLLTSVHSAFRQQAGVADAVLAANTALAREVEQRRRAETILLEKEERLSDLLDHANDLVQTTDPEGRLLYVNRTWLRVFGFGDGEWKGLNVFSLVDPSMRDRLREVLRGALGGETMGGYRLSFRTKEGEQVVLEGSANARFEDGRPTAVRTIFRDVTEQTRVEQELARSRANLDALFESTGDAIWSVDSDHRLVAFNSAFSLTSEAITGRAPKPGQEPEYVVAPWEVSWFRECYGRALQGHRFSASREERLAGELRTYELYFHPLEGPEGPEGVVVFSRDITRRKQMDIALREAKKEAEQANWAKSQFMANMSHELRTPLNSVIGFANLLLRNRAGNLGDRDREFLERIVYNGKHLLDLINQILDLSKIEAGRMDLDLREIRLQEFVPSVISQLEGQVAHRPVDLRHHWSGELVPLHTDESKLRQVLINLVGNALKFTEEGSVTVEIETESESGMARRIHVRDTGIGIPEDRLQAIFEAFRQADGSTARRFGGTGLGLAISRALCNLLGYSLSVTSIEGEGSTFTVHLDGGRDPSVRSRPEVEVEAGDREASEAQFHLSPLAGRRVLVVDDDPEVRTLVAGHLEDQGCEVTNAASGRAALATARASRPEMIITKLLMPGMSGWELLERLRDDPELADIPAVMTSLLEAGVDDDVPGPIDLLRRPVDRERLIRVYGRTMLSSHGRALVVDRDSRSRGTVRRYLEEAGLVVHTVDEVEQGRELLERMEVDLVLLGLGDSLVERLGLAEALRQTGHGVPVVLLLSENSNGAEREVLRTPLNRDQPDSLDRGGAIVDMLGRYFGTRTGVIA